MAARPSIAWHEVVRKPLIATDLEAKCLAIMCKNIDSVAETTYHMNNRFKHGIQECVLVGKIHTFKADRYTHFQSSWREYYNRPRGDPESLKFLREALDFEFIAEGGCLWDPGEVDCIVRSYHEGLVIERLKHRLEESFGHRRRTTQRFIINMFAAWSRPDNPCHSIWSKYSPPSPSNASGDKQSIDIPLHKGGLLPHDREEKLEGLNHSSNEGADRQRLESLSNVEQRGSNHGRPLLYSMPKNAVPAILERSRPTETDSPQDAERLQMENPESEVRPLTPTLLPSHEGLHLWDQSSPFVPSHLNLDVARKAIITTGVSQSTLNRIASVQESEKPRSTVVSPIAERSRNSELLPVDTLEDHLQTLSPIPTFTQVDFDKFNELVEEVGSWDQILSSLPSDWIPGTPSQVNTEVFQPTLSSPKSQTHEGEEPKSSFGPSTTEHSPDDEPQDDIRSRSQMLKLMQADFDELDAFLEELNVWGHRTPFLPSDWSPDDAAEATTEIFRSMESERLKSSEESSTPEEFSVDTSDEKIQPLSPTPAVSQADLDTFDLYIEGWYGSQPKFQLPHWSDREATLDTINLGP